MMRIRRPRESWCGWREREINPRIRAVKKVIERIAKRVRGRNSLLALKVALTAIVLEVSVSAWGFNLDETLFAKAGKRYSLPPALLYSVALVESATGRNTGLVSPWPWTLRGPRTSYYAPSKQSAVAALQQYRQQYGDAIDVGLMQINLHWHRKRLASVNQLLDPEINIMLGAQLLSESLHSSPRDVVLGIGRYHHWADETRARRYGQRVLAVFHEINKLPIK